MTTAVLKEAPTNIENIVLRKLSALSPKNRNMALAMFEFYIDGMNAQERISAETAQHRPADPQSSA